MTSGYDVVMLIKKYSHSHFSGRSLSEIRLLMSNNKHDTSKNWFWCGDLKLIFGIKLKSDKRNVTYDLYRTKVHVLHLWFNFTCLQLVRSAVYSKFPTGNRFISKIGIRHLLSNLNANSNLIHKFGNKICYFEEMNWWYQKWEKAYFSFRTNVFTASYQKRWMWINVILGTELSFNFLVENLKRTWKIFC